MTVALIVAAGSGERLGAGVPKAFVELAGHPLLSWSIEALRATPAVEEIVVALPQGAQPPAGTVGVVGGSSRSQSVLHALEAAGPGETVLVHDAARPLLTPALAEEVIAALLDDPAAAAAIAAAPVTDRGELWAVQTPQVFRRDALERALDVEADVLARATDDASLIERAGGRVLVVPNPAANIKVTTRLDLRVAEMLLGERGRVGRTDPA